MARIQDEEVPLIAESDLTRSPQQTVSFRWGAVTVALGLGIVGTLALSGNHVFTNSEDLDVAAFSTSGTELELTVSNEEYASKPHSLRNDETYAYHWNFVLEPGRENYLEVASSYTGDSTFYWTVMDYDESANFFENVDGSSGFMIAFTPEENDSGRLFTILITQTDSNGNTLATLEEKVACKYVRRELRQLTDTDRNAYFDAVSILYHTSTEEGQKLYGKYYKGSEYFIRKHLGVTTLEGCTPWHDSMVFLTSHPAFNLEFEKILRSIDPTLSAHYWEYSIDGVRYGKNWQTESPIFTADMFGSYVDLSKSTDLTAFIADGRFSDLTFIECSGKAECPEHSIYNYMIDANNYESELRLQRSGATCGIPTKSKLPGCLFVERALKSETLYGFWENVELRYHGDNHALIGGVMGCKFIAETELADYLTTDVLRYAEDITLYMVAWGRTLFAHDRQVLGRYSGAVSCPQSTDDCDDPVDCTCTLPTVLKAIEEDTFDLNYAIAVLRETGLFNDIAGASGWAAAFDTSEDDVDTDNWQYSFVGLTPDETAALLKYCAKLASYQAREIMPYSLSLGSVNDPIFWAAHNSWERFWHAIRIKHEGSEDSSIEKWTAWNQSSMVTCSWAREADSTLPFFGLVKDSETEGKYYTNMDMMRLFHPQNIRLPHIYNDLSWDHCDSEEDDETDVMHRDFRHKLHTSIRRRQAERYELKRAKGYSDEEKKQLNAFYESLFWNDALDNYEQRPRYE